MADDGSLHLAKRVRIFGLQKAPALNGRVGTAVSYDPDAGRYAVAVDGGETVRVKATNLELEPAPAPVAARTGPVAAEDSWELLECARYGEEEELQQLLDAGVPVDFADDGGNTALHKAARAQGGIEAAEKLLAGVASDPFGLRALVLRTNGAGQTALDLAVAADGLQCVPLLLSSERSSHAAVDVVQVDELRGCRAALARLRRRRQGRDNG